MKTELEVVITEKDCIDGCRGNERFCVVSTAIMRLIPEATRPEVNVNTIRFTIKEDGKTLRVAYPTPGVVRDYIISYDSGAEPKPMTFVLDNPQIAEKTPTPKGKAKTPSFKPQGSAMTRRAVRVFGEKTFIEVPA